MKTIAIIPSGGTGSRVGSSVPKQYIQIKGKEIIAYTLEVFQNCSEVDEIIIAAQSSYFQFLDDITNKYNFSKVTNIIEGGKTRQDSVYNALKSIPYSSENFIIVHDAARPLLTENILLQTIDDAKEHGAAIAAIKARDTLCKGETTISEYIDRNGVYYIQTPQIFKQSLLIKAFEKASEESFVGTDESMLVKHFGAEIKISAGSLLNFKITTKDDLELFDNIL